MKKTKKHILPKIKLLILFFLLLIIVIVFNYIFSLFKSSLFDELRLRNNFNDISSVISLFAIATTFIVLSFTMVNIVFKKLKANIWFLDETRIISLVETKLFSIKFFILNISLYDLFSLYFLIIGNNYDSVGYSITAIFCSLFIIILIFILFFRTNIFKDCERVNYIHLGVFYKTKTNKICNHRLNLLYSKYKKSNNYVTFKDEFHKNSDVDFLLKNKLDVFCDYLHRWSELVEQGKSINTQVSFLLYYGENTLLKVNYLYRLNFLDNEKDTFKNIVNYLVKIKEYTLAYKLKILLCKLTLIEIKEYKIKFINDIFKTKNTFRFWVHYKYGYSTYVFFATLIINPEQKSTNMYSYFLDEEHYINSILLNDALFYSLCENSLFNNPIPMEKFMGTLKKILK